MHLGCSEVVAEFLKDFSSIQAVESLLRKSSTTTSYLLFFMPEQLPTLLYKTSTQLTSRKRKSGVSQFAQILDRDTAVKSPYMIWSNSHKENMIKQVEEHIKTFLNQFSKNPIYNYVEPKRIVYSDIEKQLCIRGIFIEQFNAIDKDDMCDVEGADLLFKDLVVQMKQV